MINKKICPETSYCIVDYFNQYLYHILQLCDHDPDFPLDRNAEPVHGGEHGGVRGAGVGVACRYKYYI